MNKSFTFILAFIVQCILASAALCQETFGSFKGEIIATFSGDGRNMTLRRPFGYIDPKGRGWDVPSGSVTDGASIPRVFWISHPPFTGKYRSAAVVHDYYCQVKSRRWQDTHEMFYSAMRAAGVSETTAKTMYGAVYYFGPRWGIGTATRGPGEEKGMTLKEQELFLNELEAWIERDKPSIEQIAERLASDGAKLERK